MARPVAYSKGGAARPIALIGCGFVADLYMRSFALYPGIPIAGAHDRDVDRLAAFGAHWGVPQYPTIEALLQALPPGAVVLNLTNPAEHLEVSQAILAAGHHVFSEKPMLLDLSEAQSLARTAQARGLHLATAPSSVLGEAAQTLGHALRSNVAGQPLLVHAALDDGFIAQAPTGDWRSESGAPWPARDEFDTGCTLEHAGYYLSWLIAHFGPVTRVASETANLTGAGRAPDFATAVVTFRSGPVARLTTSIVASHDHRLRVFGETGVLAVNRAWDNAAPVRFHRRFVLRRRLIEAPLGRRIRLRGPTHPKVRRFGAAAMNFALGPVEMLEALDQGRVPRLAGDYALHLTEVTLAVARAGRHQMTTTCAPMEPMPWAR